MVKLLLYAGTLLALFVSAVLSFANVVYWPATESEEDTPECAELDEEVLARRREDRPFTLCGYAGLLTEGAIVTRLASQKGLTPLQWIVLTQSTLLQAGALCWRTRRAWRAF